MAFDFRKAEDARLLASNAFSGGDYDTFTNAIADSANWNTLYIAPGTYTYDVVTLPAGKAIVGLGPAEECILQSTNVVNNVTVVAPGGAGCVLENLTLQCGGGAAIHSRVVGADAITCRNVTWLFQATQGWRLNCPLHMWDCIVDTYNSTEDLFNSNDPEGFFLYGCTVRNNNAGATGGRFFNGCNVFAQGCVCISASATQHFWTSASGVDATFEGCVLEGTWDTIVDSWVFNDLSFTGCNFGGAAFGSPNATTTATIRLAGNTNYGAVPTTATANDITWDVQDFLLQRVTSGAPIAYTVKGFESRIECDTNGTGLTAITLSAIDRHGTQFLEIVSADENAAPSDILINAAGADTIANDTDVFYQILTAGDQFGGVMFGRDTTEATWTISSDTRPDLTTTKILATTRSPMPGGGNYTTLDEAIADATNWSVLQVAPGTYDYDVVVLPAGKSIVGIGSAEECILQSTNVVNGVAVVTVGGAGCVLQNLTMQCGGGAGIVSEIAGADALTCRDVIWLYQATQGWKFENPMWMWDCIVTTYLNDTIFVDTDVEGFYLFNCVVTNLHPATTNYFVSSCDPMRAFGTDFISTSGNQRFYFAAPAGSELYLESCRFSGSFATILANGNVVGIVSIIGTDMGGFALGEPSATATVRLSGNTNYGAVPTTATANGITWDVQDYLVQVVTATPYTVKGFESRIEVDTNGGADVVITACPVAQRASGLPLEIVSTDIAAAASIWTFTSIAGENIGIVTAAEGDTSYVSTAHLESVVFGIDATDALWTIQSIQPPKRILYQDIATALSVGSTYYLATTDVWTITNASAEATAGGILLGMAVGANPRAGVMLEGEYMANPELNNWDEGLTIWLYDDTAGEMDTVQPADSGDIVRAVGSCLHETNDMVFNPSHNWLEIA